eukprot:6636550-Lingulodinium_polyedra.AAC.1
MSRLTNAGVEIYCTVLGVGQLLFYPQGWLIVERSLESCGMIYGMRKSFMLRGAKSTENFVE